METKYEPGTVALVKFAFAQGEETSWVLSRLDDRKVWRSVEGHQVAASSVNNVVGVRRLVVIDADDREQVDLLVRSLLAAFPKLVQFPGEDLGRHYVDAGQVALRRLMGPAEPMGIGAVAEDRDGALWLRVTPDGFWARWKHVDNDEDWCTWDRIEAVRVVSDGSWLQ